MISMWDEAFCTMNPAIREHLSLKDGESAYRLMHYELAKAWEEVHRLLVPGGILCINIGDATRTIGKHFRLYPNSSDVLSHCYSIGFDILPEIIWRKPSNSPTKFLGSGMLPGGAYVTLEHERILILRKRGTRSFSHETKDNIRQNSAYFWEERNKWFSDVWELNGKRQTLNEKEIRKRSGAFPLEIPTRLINMYSSKFEVVLDPFLGTGTTMLAAIGSCRSSIGTEIEVGFRDLHRREVLSDQVVQVLNDITRDRVDSHLKFVNEFLRDGRIPKHRNRQHQFPVITRQEKEMSFEKLIRVKAGEHENEYEAQYEPFVFGSDVY
jgi:DNA modification methylase